MNSLRSILTLLVLAVLISPAQSARKYGGFYSEERITNARRNCEKYDWAKQVRDKATSTAAKWAAISDEELWRLVPGQDLPRCIDVTFDTITTGPRRLGCLKCGDKIFQFGNYPYTPDFEARPWKLTCPSCGVVFPTNDFGKYYESGIDEHGLFNPAKADRRLLFNTEHPDPKDPLHKFGVDDGFGYIDENGRSHKFIAYYAWKYWIYARAILDDLSNAWLYSGDKMYARKAAILLDRIADVYPDMDWKPYGDRGWFHSDGSSRIGKIDGRIWETGVALLFADSYDKILSGTDDNSQLFEFLKRQGERWKLPSAKGTRELFVRNVDDRILRCAAQAVMQKQIQGNEGMHQRTMACCAIALDTEPETGKWLDWLFLADGGRIPALILGRFDRDGVGPEAAPAYALSWGLSFAAVAKRLAEYPRYARHGIYRDFPPFRATFTAASRMAALCFATPNIGDSGATGAIGTPGLSMEFMGNGYRYLQDPAIAISAYRARGNDAGGFTRDIFAADPDALDRKALEIGRAAGPRPQGGQNMTGYGLATLECGMGSFGKALCVYYGGTIMHGHADGLNFDLLAFGSWLTPDHGYPEFAADWPSRNQWTVNTLSHNTVVVDQAPQQRGDFARSRLYKQLPGFGVCELYSPSAYPQTREYARTMVLIEAAGDNAYVVDIFRVAGGSDHLLSLHGPPGKVLATGLQLVTQAKGTYAGEDVELAARPGSFPVGYSYLYNVERNAAPPSEFQLDWKAEAGYRGLKENNDVHLRLHSFTPCKDVALADGDPPQNKPGNPRRLRYALLHRSGEDLTTTFVSVLEPYRDRPIIKSVTRVESASLSATQVALRVELANGDIDHVLWNAGPGPMTLSSGISLSGRLGFLRTRGDTVTSAVIVEGSELACGSTRLESRPAFVGKVVKMNRQLDGGGWVWVDATLPADGSLTGHELVVESNAPRNTAYTIQRVERDGELSKVYCGPITFVRGFADAANYDKGYVYDFEEGARFRIPLHAVR